MNIKEYIAKNRENIQIIYGLVLIILIPLLIALNTNYIINKYNSNIEETLRKQAQDFSRSIYVFVRDDLSDAEKLQKKVEELSARNKTVQEVTILAPEGDDFKIIVSTQKENVGSVLKSPFYKIAWTRPINEGLAIDSFDLMKTVDGEEAVKNFSGSNRFWLVAIPVNGAGGGKEALFAVKISSEFVDGITAETRNSSIFWLIITIAIVILFLSASVRLWDYAILYRKIKEVDQMKDEFISIASHELRTPLTAMKGYLSLILDGTYGKLDNKEIKRGVEIAALSTKRLESLVEDLLNVSRIEQGRLEVKNEKMELEPVMNEVIDSLRGQADEKKLALEYAAPAHKLPLISADAERLKQALINLIGNAIKYTEKGSVKISAQAKNNKLEIKIEDTGIGMSQEEQKHLFEKFYRVKNEKTRKIVGTGLGLWITKQIIELMKGKMELESMKDVGTHITITFNLA